MPPSFIIACILLLLALGFVLASRLLDISSVPLPVEPQKLGYNDPGFEERHKQWEQKITEIKAETPKWFTPLLFPAAGLGVVAFIFMGVASFDRVDETEVGIPVSFGSAQTPVGSGPDWHAPWVTMKRLDSRLQEATFNGDGRVEAQAKGGGEANLDIRVQWRISEENAVFVYQRFGTDLDRMLNDAIIPPVRECPRDITIEYEPEEILVDKRAEIADKIQTCVTESVADDGLEIIDLFLGDVNLAPEVQAEIDKRITTQRQTRTAQEQVKLAEQRLQEREVAARSAAVEAYGVSLAEQITSCGGIPEFDDDGIIVNAVPDDDCGNRFSQEYLTWLLIQTLPDAPNISIVTDSLDASLLLPTPGQ